jgi:hypothetical protein
MLVGDALQALAFESLARCGRRWARGAGGGRHDPSAGPGRRLARHGRRAGDRSRGRSAKPLIAPRSKTCTGARRARCCAPAVELGALRRADARRAARWLASYARRSAWRSRWSTTSSTSRAMPPRWARPPARMPSRESPPTCRCWDWRRAPLADRGCSKPAPRWPRFGPARVGWRACRTDRAEAVLTRNIRIMSARPLLERIATSARPARLDRGQLRQLARSCARSCSSRCRRPAATCRPTSARSSSRSRCTTCSTRPSDRLVWDVGHQSYPHKILTGRRDRMQTLRQFGGISGFPRRSESNTTPSAPRIRRRRSPPRSAWRRLAQQGRGDQARATSP